MTSGKIRIALDLGYASIGWVVSRGMLEGLEILGCGTVIFEPDRCLASDRRAFRRQRRHIRATRTRIERMRAFLTARGVLTPALAGVRHPHPEPWRLAAEALTAGRILTAAEFWAVLLWYAHNRGYDGNRLWSRRGGETEAADDTKKVAAAKAALESRKAHSMAEAVRDIVTRGNAAGPAVANYKEQNMAFPREVVAEEVGRIVLAHVGKLPGLTPEVAAALLADPIREAEALRGWPGIPKAYLGGFLFGQTKPRFDNRIPTLCPISGQKTPSVTTEAFLAFRWASLLSRVRVGDMNDLRALSPEEMASLNASISTYGRFTKKDFFKHVRALTKASLDNLEALFSVPGSEEALVRYPGLAAIDKAVGIDNLRDDAESQKAVRRLSHALFLGKAVAVEDLSPYLTPKGKAKLEGSRALQADLPSGRAPYAKSILQAATAAIFKGENPWGEGGVLYRDATKEDPLPEAELDRTTNNHLVRHRVRILLRLLADIVKDYAENNPARVEALFLEVARDIKDFSGKKKKAIETELNALRRAHQDAVAKAAKDLNIPEAAVTASLARKMRIAKDLNYTCPYTGQLFDAEAIRRKVVDLDHILPRSQRQTDALDALVLTYREVNKLKGARTALQFIRDCGGQTVIAHDANGGESPLTIRTESVFKKFVEDLKTPPFATKDGKIAKARKQKLLMLSTKEEAEMTAGMLTQTSAIAKLAARAVRGWFVLRKCKVPTLTMLPGRITKEIRSHYDLLGMLAAFDDRLRETYTLDGETHTHVVPKGDMRSLTHMHHAVDAIAILLAGTLITPQNRVWQLMTRRHLNEDDRLFLMANGPFTWDSHGNPHLKALPHPLDISIRKALGELRCVRYASKRLGRTVLEQTQWGVEKIENGRVYIRQRQGDKIKRDDIALSAAYGLNPRQGTPGKLKANNAIYVGDSNYAIALTNPPCILRERFVWRQLQELAAKNGGKAPKLLRKGDLVQITQEGRCVLWMIRSIKDSKRGIKINMTYPYNAEGRLTDGVSYCKRDIDLLALLKKRLITFPRYTLTGIPSCPITSSKSPEPTV